MYRLAKEEINDKQEAEDRRTDLEKMKDSNRDGADIRNAVALILPILPSKPLTRCRSGS